MPADFERCVATKGSRKVTKKLRGGKYVYGCSVDGKTWVWGEMHQKKPEDMSPGEYAEHRGRRYP